MALWSLAYKDWTLFQTLPESARFLVAAGRKEEAKTILEKASKTNGKTLPPGRLVQSVQVR